MSLDMAYRQADKERVTEVFNALKRYYGVDNLDIDRQNFIKTMVKEYGYLPYSHQKALDELSTAEVLVGLEQKFELNNVYAENIFNYDIDNLSPVHRAGYDSPEWLQKEQLNIKFINLAALGNGNKDESIPGKFEDWLRQILILPSGNLDFDILATVIYLGPFHPRDFGCAYLPKSKFISESLEDIELKEKLGLDITEQVRLFVAFSQLAGHPVMYDVLPQTGRYAKTVIANPHIARWYNIPQLNLQLKHDLDNIAEELKQQHDHALVTAVKDVIAGSLDGNSENSPVDEGWLEEKMEHLLDEKRKQYSYNMTNRENQEKLIKYVKVIIAEELGVSPDKVLKEEDIGDNHYQVIRRLIKEGLWPSPGGAWCSCGVPVYDRMVAGGGHPLFKHYDVDGFDVSHFANLDCQTPFYFVFLENGEFNRPVIDFWTNYLLELQQLYNFDAFRFDHVDHVVDRVSQTSRGVPISYRVPAAVLAEVIYKLREKKHYFGTLAEYMLWDGYFREYHQDMGFDTLWGNDIVYQFAKDIKAIINDNEILQMYNYTLQPGERKLSILKNYNNQDGEFREIDQYPGQMGEEGALFKWFKFKFVPLTPQAERAVMYADGDESFTITGLEKIIGSEISLKRNNNEEFFRKFDAINRFALNNIYCRYGIAEMHYPHDRREGLATWSIKKQPEFGDDERLFIVANEFPPRQIIRITIGRDQLASQPREYKPFMNVEVNIPEGFQIVNEYILPENSLEFIDVADIPNLNESILSYSVLNPSEFHIYRIKRI